MFCRRIPCWASILLPWVGSCVVAVHHVMLPEEQEGFIRTGFHEALSNQDGLAVAQGLRSAVEAILPESRYGHCKAET